MIKLVDLLEGTRCWKGYEKKGMKTMFGKRVPNCVKREAKLPDEGFSDKDQMIMYEGDLEEDLRAWFGKGGRSSADITKNAKVFTGSRSSRRFRRCRSNGYCRQHDG